MQPLATTKKSSFKEGELIYAFPSMDIGSGE
jgi:hypothetical protein